MLLRENINDWLQSNFDKKWRAKTMYSPYCVDYRKHYLNEKKKLGWPYNQIIITVFFLVLLVYSK